MCFFFAKGVIEIEILTDEVRGIGVILGRFAAELNLFADLIELSAIYSEWITSFQVQQKE